MCIIFDYNGLKSKETSKRIMFRLLLIGVIMGSAFSAEILAVFPHTGKSHFDVFHPFLLALAGRGHHLTVISFFPQKSAVGNYTDISLEGVVPIFVNALKFEHLQGIGSFFDFLLITDMGVSSCDPILKSSQVQDLFKSSKTFDLIFIEMFNTDCFLTFVDRFKAPYVGFSSSAMFPTMFQRLGSFDNPAYFPNLFYPFAANMSFYERMINTGATVAMRAVRTFLHSAREHHAASQALGQQVDIQKVARNVSLALVNSHFTIQSSRPLVPAVVEVGGLHILPAKPLPKDIDKFLNDSTHGALLFSMGSVLQSSSFPSEKRKAILDAFAELPIKVIMKWEEENLPGKPDNVMISPWLPQRDIMAHPRVVAFMGHGGLLSTSEAVYCGLPMVLMPMFGDQPNNVAHLVATGAAVKLPYSDISKESVLAALRAVLYDSRYKERAQTLSARFKDRPMSPLDTAVYWTEYVIRHKGAPHLRSPAVEMPWYQLWLIDVVAVLLAALFTFLYIMNCTMCFIVRSAIKLGKHLSIIKTTTKKKIH